MYCPARLVPLVTMVTMVTLVGGNCPSGQHFGEYRDSQVSGGSRVLAMMSGDGSGDACQAVCSVQPDETCIGCDLSAQDQCYVIITQSQLLNDITYARGVTHYRRETTCMETVNGVDRSCLFHYVGPQRQTGHLVGGGTNLETCAAECVADPECQAFEWIQDDIDNQDCRLHRQDLDLTQRSEFPGTLQFRRMACRESPGTCESFQFTQYAESRVDVAIETVVTPGSCGAECEMDQECVGYDERLPGGCYLVYGNDSGIVAMTTDLGSTHYRRQTRCYTPGMARECTYNQVGSGYVYTGEEYIPVLAASPAICGAECIAEPACRSWQFNLYTAGESKCKLILERLNNDNRQPSTMDNSTVQYRFAECRTPSPTPPPAGGDTPAPPGPGDSCQAYMYERTRGVAVDGSILETEPGAITCESSCRVNPQCGSYDVNTANNQCFLVTTAATLLDEPVMRSGFHHYQSRAQCTADNGAWACTYTFVGTYMTEDFEWHSADTESMCGVACTVNVDCQAYQFTREGVTGQQCALVLTELTEDNRVMDTQTRQHRRVSCSGDPRRTPTPTPAVTTSMTTTPATTTTTTIPITTASTTSTASTSQRVTTTIPRPAPDPNICADPDFRVYSGQHIYGGSRIGSARGDISLCQDACLDFSSCAGYDYNSAGLCYIGVDNEATLSNIVMETGVNHYRLEAMCTASNSQRTCTYQSVGGFTTPSATTVSGAGQLSDCARSCIDAVTCTAFEWSISGQCKHITGQLSVEQRVSNMDVQQYRIVNCQDCPAFLESPDTSIPSDGLPREHLTSLDLCRDGCIETTDCRGFDFTASAAPSSRCTFFMSSDSYFSRTDTTGTNNYWLVCRPSTTQPSPPPASPTACQDGWEVRTGSSSGGGVFRFEATSVDACRRLCADDINCVAADIDRETLCWLHYDADNLLDRRMTAGVDQHVLIFRCQQACQTTYDFLANTRGASGGPVQAGLTLQECLDLCTADLACTAVDIRMPPSGSGSVSCSLYTGQAPDTVTENGSSHFAVAARCP